MKYYIIAGEASGDLHGSNLMKGLYAADNRADCRYWGGPLMDSVYKSHQVGSALVHDYKDEAVIGFTQVFLRAGHFIKKLNECHNDIEKWNPDVVILIDYPGFNFRIAEFAHKKGFKVFYYIAPKVWASRESRIRKLRQYVDKLFIVFPFEKEYFRKKSVPYIYEGNPIIDAIDLSEAMIESREDFIKANSIEDRPYIAILAGSRKGEVKSMMPVCISFADMLKNNPDYANYQFIVAGAPSRTIDDYAPFIAGREDYIKIIFGQTHSIIRHAKAAVINSGTASLEACIIGTPQVVAYSGANFNFYVGKQIIRIEFISLGNLILGRKAFKELMQYYFTPDNLYSEVRRLIEDEEYRGNMKSDYKEIRAALGEKGASTKIAEAMVKELKKHSGKE
ncbi:MAG: lipid-A-disaccharide synthase [Candidatus Cryptobacteroides sp.]